MGKSNKHMVIPTPETPPAPYQPEHLPELYSLAEGADWLRTQAFGLMYAGQKIVGDFRIQAQALADESDQIEIERREAIRQVNIAADQRQYRNSRMRDELQAMIDFYTSYVEPQPQTRLPLARKPRRTLGRLLGFAA